MSHLALEVIDLRNKIASLEREISRLRVQLDEVKQKVKAHDAVIDELVDTFG